MYKSTRLFIASVGALITTVPILILLKAFGIEIDYLKVLGAVGTIVGIIISLCGLFVIAYSIGEYDSEMIKNSMALLKLKSKVFPMLQKPDKEW